MSDLPTGTVTLLFTDIEGSTRLVQHLGTQYSEVLSEVAGCSAKVLAEALGCSLASGRDALSGLLHLHKPA